MSAECQAVSVGVTVLYNVIIGRLIFLPVATWPVKSGSSWQRKGQAGSSHRVGAGASRVKNKQTVNLTGAIEIEIETLHGAYQEQDTAGPDRIAPICARAASQSKPG